MGLFTSRGIIHIIVLKDPMKWNGCSKQLCRQSIRSSLIHVFNVGTGEVKCFEDSVCFFLCASLKTKDLTVRLSGQLRWLRA